MTSKVQRDIRFKELFLMACREKWGWEVDEGILVSIGILIWIILAENWKRFYNKKQLKCTVD